MLAGPMYDEVAAEWHIQRIRYGSCGSMAEHTAVLPDAKVASGHLLSSQPVGDLLSSCAWLLPGHLAALAIKHRLPG